MGKEKEKVFVEEQMKNVISTLEKRASFNEQSITELEKLLEASKYGSVRHVTKVVGLSTLRNYQVRLEEIVDAFKEIKEMEVVVNIKKTISQLVEESNKNFKSSNEALNAAEIFTNDYIKNEILVNTYRDLENLYKEVNEYLTNIEQGPKEVAIEEEKKTVTPKVPAPKKEVL